MRRSSDPPLAADWLSRMRSPPIVATAPLSELKLKPVLVPIMSAPTPTLPSKLTTRSEEHTSELQSLMRISYAVFCLTKKKAKKIIQQQLTQKHQRQDHNTEPQITRTLSKHTPTH